jgi:hypothetical protein
MSHSLSSSEHSIKHQHGIEVIIEKLGALEGNLKIGCRALVPNSDPALAPPFWFLNLDAPRIGSACNHAKILLRETQGRSSLEVTHQNKNGIIRDEVLPGMARDVIRAYRRSIR